jgi:phage repressor protein C with HTH and peptisase S24 domain
MTVAIHEFEEVPADRPFLGHGDIWRALDLLAHANGLTASGLARRAGLDPTTFNRSKRQTRDGKLRWPSTESLAKVLQATGCSLRRLVDLVEDGGKAAPGPNGGASAAARFAAVAMGRDLIIPRGHTKVDIDLPGPTGETTLAIRIGSRDLEPAYRIGDIVAVAPDRQLKPGDRVLVHSFDGVLRAGRLARLTGFRIDLDSLEPGKLQRHLQMADVSWVARIVWASQ